MAVGLLIQVRACALQALLLSLRQVGLEDALIHCWIPTIGPNGCMLGRRSLIDMGRLIALAPLHRGLLNLLMYVEVLIYQQRLPIRAHKARIILRNLGINVRSIARLRGARAIGHRLLPDNLWVSYSLCHLRLRQDVVDRQRSIFLMAERVVVHRDWALRRLQSHRPQTTPHGYLTALTMPSLAMLPPQYSSLCSE